MRTINIILQKIEKVCKISNDLNQSTKLENYLSSRFALVGFNLVFEKEHIFTLELIAKSFDCISMSACFVHIHMTSLKKKKIDQINLGEPFIFRIELSEINLVINHHSPETS